MRLLSQNFPRMELSPIFELDNMKVEAKRRQLLIVRVVV
jgi:hypothetical protein